MEPAGKTRRGRKTPSPERVALVRKRHLQLLGLLVFMVFASALGGDFIWTDHDDLVEGAYRIDSWSDIRTALTQTGEEYRSIKLATPPAAEPGTWQPLVIFANTLSWSLWGDCAFCFHLENLLLHLALVIGVYALGRHLLSHRRHGNRIAVWAAALYAVHPATVSSVAWVGGRPILLAAAFSVWTLVIFTRLQATTKSRPGHVRRWLLGLTLTSTFAMISHGSAMMLPLLALFVATFEAMERGRHPFGGISPRRIKGIGVLFGIALVIAFYRMQVIGGTHLFTGHPADGLANNIGTALRHFWFLLGESVLPGEPIVSDAWPLTVRWGAAEVAGLLGLLLVVAGVMVGLKFKNPAALGVGWFLLWLLPGAALFPGVHYHDSQVLYLAVWGLTLAFAYALLRLWRPIGRQLMPGSEGILFVPLIAVLAVITAFSNVRFWDREGLFESEVISDPLFIEGRVQLARLSLEAGEPAIAADHLRTAIEVAQDDSYTAYYPAFETLLLLGRAQAGMGQFEDADASFVAAAKLAPDNPDVAYWQGVAKLQEGRPAEAETLLRAVLKRRPGHIDAKAELGVALAEQQRYVEAHPFLAEAITAGHGNVRRHRALARAFIDAGELAGAGREIEATLALEESANDHALLAWVLWQQGEQDAARQSLELASGTLLPGEDRSYVEWVGEQTGIWATASDGEETPVDEASVAE